LKAPPAVQTPEHGLPAGITASAPSRKPDSWALAVPELTIGDGRQPELPTD
jgi:hypothetical protein